MAKKIFWYALKVIGMLFVILNCYAFIYRMSIVRLATGNYGFLVAILLVDAGLLYWAYRVIWRPIETR